MISRIFILLFAVLPYVLSSYAYSVTPIIVAQKDKEFTVKSIDIKTGDSVRFKNEDPFFHNVFSLSDVSFFDLGSFPKGDHRDIKFEKPGVIEVECAIHPAMKMIINVKD